MMSLTFGLFTQVSGSGPLGPLVWHFVVYRYTSMFFFYHFPKGDNFSAFLFVPGQQKLF